MDQVGGGAVGGFDLVGWYMEIPVISRLYMTSAFLTTAACAIDIISPFSLYFNFNLIFVQGQVWRLFTTFFVLWTVLHGFFVSHVFLGEILSTTRRRRFSWQ